MGGQTFFYGLSVKHAMFFVLIVTFLFVPIKKCLNLLRRTASLTCQITEDRLKTREDRLKHAVHTYPLSRFFWHIWANYDLLYFGSILPTGFHYFESGSMRDGWLPNTLHGYTRRFSHHLKLHFFEPQFHYVSNTLFHF
jgi:hypothetical protein